MPIIIYAIQREPSLWKILSIKSTSLIRLWGKVVYNVEKSYVDRLDARQPRDFNLFITSHEFFIEQKDFYRIFHMIFGTVRQEFSNLDSSVFVHELE